MYNPVKFLKNRKLGLALGSGGARGLSHISVIEYLHDMNIPVDMISGSSIGAVVGAVYLCGGISKLKKDMLSLTRKELLSVADFTLPKSGLVRGKNFVEFMKRYIPADALIEDLPRPLAILATDFYSGTPVIIRKGHILDALRASVSIPGVFVPARRGDSFCIDGGVANPLPVDVVKDMGAGLTVAVNLHPGLKISRIKKYVRSGTEKFGIRFLRKKLRAQRDSAGQRIMGSKKSCPLPVKGGRKPVQKEKTAYPGIFEILFQSVDIMEYVNTQNILKYHSPTVLIEPDLLQTGTLDFFDAAKIIEAGFAAADMKKSELVRKIKFWL